jgi:flavin reductase (DIM6/NTAB) family NADH-FMN oxidoreductase RutF
MHTTIQPAILYAGTPVVLISTLNPDGSANLAPMSSAWWLGWSCMLGLDATSKTTENLRRTRECVLNLPSSDLVEVVDRLSLLTGSHPVPLHKRALGYRHEPDKFARAGVTPVRSDLVAPPRVLECPIQLEARVASISVFAARDPRMAIPTRAIEVTVERVHVDERLQADGHRDRIDPDKWKPLIMSFRQFYGLGQRLHTSRLASSPEDMYAPWKQRGLRAALGRAALRLANRRYAVVEPDDLSSVEEAQVDER